MGYLAGDYAYATTENGWWEETMPQGLAGWMSALRAVRVEHERIDSSDSARSLRGTDVEVGRANAPRVADNPIVVS